MMNISGSVCKIIKKYGCTAKTDNRGKIQEIRAFIEPLRYKYKEYSDSKRHFAGCKRNGLYLFISAPETKLEAGTTVIHTQNHKYIVKRCETYFVKNCPVYVWAVLSQYGEALEDDYEPNRETG